MFISDACLGLKESLGDFYPEALWQRCVVHFYRNVFSYVPRGEGREVSLMLKANTCFREQGGREGKSKGSYKEAERDAAGFRGEVGRGEH